MTSAQRERDIFELRLAAPEPVSRTDLAAEWAVDPSIVSRIELRVCSRLHRGMVHDVSTAELWRRRALKAEELAARFERMVDDLVAERMLRELDDRSERDGAKWEHCAVHVIHGVCADCAVKHYR